MQNSHTARSDETPLPNGNNDYTQYAKKTKHNYSDQIFTTTELTIITKELSYVPTRKTIPIAEYATNIEKALQQLAPGGNTNYMIHLINERNKMKQAKTRQQKTDITRKELHAINQRMTKQ